MSWDVNSRSPSRGVPVVVRRRPLAAPSSRRRLPLPLLGLAHAATALVAALLACLLACSISSPSLAWGSGKSSGSKNLCARLSGGSASRCAYHSCHGGHDCGCEGLAHVHPTSLDSTLLACVLEPALGSVHMPGAGLVPTPKAENAHMHPCSPQVELQPPAPLGLQRGTRPFSAARHVLEHEICDDLVY